MGIEGARRGRGGRALATVWEDERERRRSGVGIGLGLAAGLRWPRGWAGLELGGPAGLTSLSLTLILSLTEKK